MKIDITKSEAREILNAIESLIDKEEDTISHEKLAKKILQVLK